MQEISGDFAHQGLGACGMTLRTMLLSGGEADKKYLAKVRE